MKKHQHLIVAVIVLLLYGGLRTYNLLGFPPFLDEIDHIDWANDIYQLQPFTGAHNGKLFGLWWMALFDLRGVGALFMVRAATVIFNLIGAAVVYSIVRRYTHEAEAAGAVLVYAFLPYSYFYDRMALVDTYVTVWALVAVWFALRYTTRGHLLNAVFAGFALTGAMLGKATGIVWTPIPILIYALYWRRHSWRGVLATYAAFGVTWGAVYGVLIWRGYRYFGTATTVVGTNRVTDALVRLGNNIVSMWQIDVRYFSLSVVIIGIGLLVYLVARRWRIGLALILAALVPLGGLLVFATKMSGRYFHFHTPFIVIAMLVAIGLLRKQVNRHGLDTALMVAGGIWLMLFANPFISAYHFDSANVPLTDLDRLEYISSDAAGFAIPEVAAYLREHADGAIMIGMFPNCNALTYYLPAGASLTCPALRLDQSHQEDVTALIENAVAESDNVWLVYEDVAFTSLDGIDAQFEAVATFSRPDEITELQVMRVRSDTG